MTSGPHHEHPVGGTDSAGQPWAGRSFGETPFADDDGSAPPEYLRAIGAFRAGRAAQADVVDALRGVRLLIPLVASLGESGTNERGVTVDKSADLAIVTVAGPDGRSVLPVFSSVAAMQAWNPKARPVPADAVRVALAAADESTDLVVVDPTSDTEFVVRRPALWAVAQSKDWRSPLDDEAVSAEFASSAQGEADVAGVSLRAGDPAAQLHGPELVVELALRPGLDEAALSTLLSRLQDRWSRSEVIATRVDSLALRVVAAT
ncbi:SseB family protein [Salinibacterium sp. SYSU T00001]|uniref:SseB family protein n=1 Tax=Homoserinimonas sedimenticola TaxID=2986805 RepID=UPI0022364619|nr:SseB family protein [Salinibacterium sedimenticola]MCW4386783.1 SseB family protein [Salinibacterium sedimenticola]